MLTFDGLLLRPAHESAADTLGGLLSGKALSDTNLGENEQLFSIAEIVDGPAVVVAYLKPSVARTLVRREGIPRHHVAAYPHFPSIKNNEVRSRSAASVDQCDTIFVVDSYSAASVRFLQGNASYLRQAASIREVRWSHCSMRIGWVQRRSPRLVATPVLREVACAPCSFSPWARPMSGNFLLR